MNKNAKTFYEFGPYRVDAGERLLMRQGAIIPLTPKAFELLLLMLGNSGHLLERRELMSQLWRGTFVEEGNLSDNISRLRHALGDNRKEPKYIETVSRRGYRFIARVTEVSDGNDHFIVEERIRAHVVIEENDADEQAIVPSLHRYQSLYEPDEGEHTGRPDSIAVLPFKMLGAGHADEYLGLGITDALITRLGNLRQIIVRPTSAVLKYTDAHVSSIAAGRELMVDAVLDGKIQKAVEQIRVTVQLVSVKEDALLWADKYDEDFTDIFTIEDRISEQVARALTLKLTVAERKRLTSHGTENIAAYREYLKGRYHWNRFTPEGFAKALEPFMEAIRLDPRYALAHAGLAEYYMTAGFWGSLAPDESFTKAKSEAIKALEIDDMLAEAHNALAYNRLLYDWDWKGAEAEFKRALEINPHSSATRLWHTHYLAMMGRFDEAIAEVERAKEIDPLSPFINALHGFCFYLARQPERALEEHEKTLELNPDFPVTHYAIGQAYRLMGKYEEAVAASRKAVDLSNGAQMMLGQLGHNLAIAGRHDEARKVLAQLQELSRQCYVSAYHLALIHTGLGEYDEAFFHLEKSSQDHDQWLLWLRSEPILDSLRSDARFQRFLSRVGFTS